MKRRKISRPELDGRQLRHQLARILPEAALAEIDLLIGGLFGDTLDDVIAFIVISWLHQTPGLDRFEHAGARAARQRGEAL